MNRSDDRRVSKPVGSKWALLEEFASLSAEISDPDHLLFMIVNRLKAVLNFDECNLAMLSAGGAFYYENALQDSQNDRVVWNNTLVPGSHG